MKKNLDDLNELEKQALQEFIKDPRPGLGIESVILTVEESYVIFSDSEQ